MQNMASKFDITVLISRRLADTILNILPADKVSVLQGNSSSVYTVIRNGM